MPQSDEEFSRELILKLAEAAMETARPAVFRASTHLADAMTVFVDDEFHGGVYIPQYWAIYLHNGTPKFYPRGTFPSKYQNIRKGSPAKVLVWFLDPTDDPRIPGPDRYKDTQRLNLSAAQFKAMKKSGRLIVSKYKEAVPGTYFFANDQGMQGFTQRAGAIVSTEFSRHVKDVMGDLMRAKANLTVKL